MAHRWRLQDLWAPRLALTYFFICLMSHCWPTVMVLAGISVTVTQDRYQDLTISSAFRKRENWHFQKSSSFILLLLGFFSSMLYPMRTAEILTLETSKEMNIVQKNTRTHNEHIAHHSYEKLCHFKFRSFIIMSSYYR